MELEILTSTTKTFIFIFIIFICFVAVVSEKDEKVLELTSSLDGIMRPGWCWRSCSLCPEQSKESPDYLQYLHIWL